MVERASHILIGTHRNPDGDALGSALALSHWLDGRGVSNEVICHNEPPRNLRWMPGVGRIRQEPRGKADLGLILDLDSLDRLGDAAVHFAECPRTIVVDHHVPHESPGDLRIIDVGAPATCVILTRLLAALDAEITPAIATCLLTGTVTDTGSFRFRNTNAEALSVASFLVARGADLATITEEVFTRKPLAATRLLGFVLETMRLNHDETLGWSVVPLEEFEHTGAKDEDTEGFANEILAIGTVRAAAILREPKRNRVRVSLRSRAGVDVSAVAREFGGGGHKNASGFTFDGPLDEIEGRLVTSLTRCLASS